MPVNLDYRSMLSQWIQQGAETLSASCADGNLDMLEALAQKIVDALKSGGKILLCGNGGSAAQAQHISAEFVGRFKRERLGLAAISLTTDTSILTAVGNDYGYEQVFARQIESIGKAGDVLIGLSTSGNSSNVIKAVDVALTRGLTIACFTGRKGGKLASMVPLVFRVASDDTSHVQEAHITALHALCEVVESAIAS